MTSSKRRRLSTMVATCAITGLMFGAITGWFSTTPIYRSVGVMQLQTQRSDPWWLKGG